MLFDVPRSTGYLEKKKRLTKSKANDINHINMKITLSKMKGGGLFRSYNEQFSLDETKNALKVVLKGLASNGCDKIQQAEKYIARGDYMHALKEMNLLYDHFGFTKREVLVDYLYQAWESYAEYRHHRSVRAKRRGGEVEVACQHKAEECDRGRMQVHIWKNQCFDENSHEYSQKALNLLLNAPLFGDLQDGHVLPGLLAKHMERRHFPKGRLLFKVMSDPEVVYFLEVGEVEITGSRVNEKIQAGNYFGYGPPMIGLFHSSYCRTTRDCTMYVIDADTFSQLVRQFEGVKHRLIVDSVKQIRSLRGQEEIEEAEQRKRARNAEKGIFCKDFIDTPASTK